MADSQAFTTLQRCDSYGDELSDADEPRAPCENALLRHRCDACVLYFKPEQSESWGVFADDFGVTRCNRCRRMWPIKMCQVPARP